MVLRFRSGPVCTRSGVSGRNTPGSTWGSSWCRRRSLLSGCGGSLAGLLGVGRCPRVSMPGSSYEGSCSCTMALEAIWISCKNSTGVICLLGDCKSLTIMLACIVMGWNFIYSYQVDISHFLIDINMDDIINFTLLTLCAFVFFLLLFGRILEVLGLFKTYWFIIYLTQH